MSERRHPHVVHHQEVEPTEQAHGKFALRHRALAQAVGGRGIGCGMVEIPPGKAAWPFHYHCANEEAMYVLSGSGVARIGDARIAIGPGDYLAFPPGPATPHQTINTGAEPLVYLVLSTMLTTEVVGYPDSKKIGALAATVGPDGVRRPLLRALFREETQVSYYDREGDDA